MCAEPSGQQKAAVRFAVRTHDRELLDAPWSAVYGERLVYLAARLDDTLAVVVSYPRRGGEYLRGLRAVNGTARTFTDLPEGGQMGELATQALDCVS